jgi:hypothetical protein
MNARVARRGLLVLLGLGLLPLAVLAQARAERPTYAVGDVWALADATYRLDRLERNVYVFTADGEREIWLTRDLGLTFVRRGADLVEINPAPRVRWPLEVGKWGSMTTLVRLGSGSADAWLTWRVEAREPVSAGGRTYDAFRVRYSLNADRPGLDPNSAVQRLGNLAREITFDVTFWYAPEPQRIVKASSSKTLLTFGRPAARPPSRRRRGPRPPHRRRPRRRRPRRRPRSPPHRRRSPDRRRHRPRPRRHRPSRRPPRRPPGPGRRWR